jgi:hypothetical protein
MVKARELMPQHVVAQAVPPAGQSWASRGEMFLNATEKHNIWFSRRHEINMRQAFANNRICLF